MRVLLLGSGGREHALAAALRRDPEVTELIAAPGNPGIAALARTLPLDLADIDAIVALAKGEHVDFVVVGPEAPLVAGVVDALAAVDILAFGPTAAAARLEGSKGFTKDLCAASGIPTAAYARFTDLELARAHVGDHALPVVIKADGLAAGKGVVIASTAEEAEAALEELFAGSFGEVDVSVVVEDFLPGEELSFFALCDGARALPFGSAQDHKRLREGDKGPNTGGMGAVSPAPGLDAALETRILNEIVEPTLRAMAAGGAPFRGMLFAGLMITADGPKLIEYNVRLGDPEAQALLPRLEGCLLALLVAAARGDLTDAAARFSDEVAVAVVLAAQGYPAVPLRGTDIRELAEVATLPGIRIFHAATRQDGSRLLADGGRVLTVTALGPTAREAQRQAYRAVDRIDWHEGFCRRDIGWRAVARETDG